jgi:hypothetical protein
MKSFVFIFLFITLFQAHVHAQNSSADNQQNPDITSLINKYSIAREKRDTVLLKSVLTADVDQLVSSGEWRNGIQGSVKGMLRSSGSNPGARTLTIDKVRFLNSAAAIVDARYEIKNADGTVRKMWSTFIVVNENGAWKITAIRNMLPASGS